jgi:hypothetical protein
MIFCERMTKVLHQYTAGSFALCALIHLATFTAKAQLSLLFPFDFTSSLSALENYFIHEALVQVQPRASHFKTDETAIFLLLLVKNLETRYTCNRQQIIFFFEFHSFCYQLCRFIIHAASIRIFGCMAVHRISTTSSNQSNKAAVYSRKKLSALSLIYMLGC